MHPPDQSISLILEDHSSLESVSSNDVTIRVGAAF